MNHTDCSGYSRRWYDHVGRITLLLLLSEKLPEAVRRHLAANLSELIDDTRRQQQGNPREALSLGPEKILGLYQASKRQRWYDATPETRRAFSRMSALPPALLAEFAENTLWRCFTGKDASPKAGPSVPANLTLAWFDEAETADAEGATPIEPCMNSSRHAYRLSHPFGL